MKSPRRNVTNKARAVSAPRCWRFVGGSVGRASQLCIAACILCTTQWGIHEMSEPADIRPAVDTTRTHLHAPRCRRRRRRRRRRRTQSLSGVNYIPAHYGGGIKPQTAVQTTQAHCHCATNTFTLQIFCSVLCVHPPQQYSSPCSSLAPRPTAISPTQSSSPPTPIQNVVPYSVVYRV